MKRIATTIALVLALPLAVTAQEEAQEVEQEQKQEMEMEMEHGMMMRAHAGHGGAAMMMEHPGPGMLLRMEEALGLTADQVTELEAMHAEAREAMQTHREAAQTARTRAHEAMMADAPDLDAFQAALEEAAMHDVQATVAMARVHLQANEVLTPEQQETLGARMKEMHENMRGEGMQHRQHGEGQGEGMQHRHSGG